VLGTELRFPGRLPNPLNHRANSSYPKGSYSPTIPPLPLTTDLPSLLYGFAYSGFKSYINGFVEYMVFCDWFLPCRNHVF